MAETVNVASRVHTAISISRPVTDTDKPGLVQPSPVFVLAGANHPAARNGVGITRGVDAEVFRSWLQAQRDAYSPLADQVMEVPDDMLAPPPPPPVMTDTVNPEHFGFEPALQRMTSGENANAGADGSTVTHPGPATATEMAATSDTPQDDRPTSQTDIMPMAHEQEAATDITAPEDENTGRRGRRRGSSDQSSEQPSEQGQE